MSFTTKIAVVVGLIMAGSYSCNTDSLSPRGEVSLRTPLTLKSVHESDDKHLVQKYTLGDPNLAAKTVVEVYATKSTGSTLAKRESRSQSPDEERPIDLTPSTCTSQVCYSGSFQGPKKTDCDTIVAAQLYNSTGSLRAFPGTYVLVYSGTCVVVFQNPIGKPEYTHTLDYNWAKLGTVILDLQKKCDKPDDLSIGGACKIDHYLKFNFKNVSNGSHQPTTICGTFKRSYCELRTFPSSCDVQSMDI
ncbi:hypothetical protein MJO28_011899 [Puccinia striiformis f. sp. tritici]|uniref:Uncharacterized protein n=2 Tax=Puccinia striiformis TaxID=27350 RepID=A0A2S4UXC9_9BASI|nr:hypothetical protein MJO28_011899 [Puccinia striiformis f. sp. tritici]POW01916.1 hypothetical protein PSTT_12177 [Puccinia striiformis]